MVALADSAHVENKEKRLLLGLGSDGGRKDVVVRWPDGEEQRFGRLAVDRCHLLRRR